MHPLSRKLVKIGIILVAVGVTMALLCGLFGGVVWALGHRVGDSGVFYMLLAGFAYTAYFAYLASLVSFAGGVSAGGLGLTLKVVALGTGHFRRH